MRNRMKAALLALVLGCSSEAPQSEDASAGSAGVASGSGSGGAAGSASAGRGGAVATAGSGGAAPGVCMAACGGSVAGGSGGEVQGGAAGAGDRNDAGSGGEPEGGAAGAGGAEPVATSSCSDEWRDQCYKPATSSRGFAQCVDTDTHDPACVSCGQAGEYPDFYAAALDCNKADSDGCETDPLDPLHCGRCGHFCNPDTPYCHPGGLCKDEPYG